MSMAGKDGPSRPLSWNGAHTMNTVEVISTDRIHQANENAGFYFFEPDTMRFFRSRVSQHAYRGPGGTYFVTSEQYNADSPRLYSVRQALDDGSIETIGKFQQYKTRAQAHAAAKRFAREGAPDETTD